MLFALLAFLMIGCGEDESNHDKAARADDTYSSVVINEIVTKSTEGKDWIELYNRGEKDAEISGWKMLDEKEREEPFVFPEGTMIKKGEYLVVEKGENGFEFGLGSQDAVRLFNKNGELMGKAAWIEGDTPENQSYGRIPDGTGQFTTISKPTPGKANGK